MIRLTNKGKEVLAQDKVIKRLWKTYGALFAILRQKSYGNEEDLLPLLKSWAKKGKRDSMAIGNVTVDTGVFYTHRAYIRGISGRREFGDVTFVTCFSSKPMQNRVAYANTFQIKVGDSAIDAYRGLFGSTHRNQLSFYRTKLIEALHPIYIFLICDFLHYWLIGANRVPHPILEIPLSLTWLGNSSKVYSRTFSAKFDRRYLKDATSYAGMDTMLESLLLIAGINVRYMIRLCTPSLRKILESILKMGVHKSLASKNNDPTNINPDQPHEHRPRPEFPIASSIVVATEVVFLE